MGFGNKVESMSKLKKQMAAQAAAADSVWIKYVPANGELIVRFLEEPDEWVRFSEAWDNDAKKSYPVGEDFTPPDDHRISIRYLANALIIGDNEKDDRVVPLLITKSVMDKVVKKYDRYGTILDRDYIVSKSGSGLQTEYELEAEAPEKRNVKKHLSDLHDLEDVLEGAWRQYANDTGASFVEDDDDEDELTGDEDEEEITPPKRRRRKAAPEPEEDEDDPEEETPPAPKRRRKAAPEPEEDPEEDPEEEEEPPKTKRRRRPAPEPEPEPDPEPDPDDDEDDFYTRDELEAMTKGQLDSIARDNEMNPRLYKKDQLVDALLGELDEEPF